PFYPTMLENRQFALYQGRLYCTGHFDLNVIPFCAVGYQMLGLEMTRYWIATYFFNDAAYRKIH
ncbi:hypothetical protein, partial [Echinicola shivajiensis]|uniref:hypothetical protein n=1 Tax=Echinicola shivajiensis TaxID=1035916 RepID=UPI001BFC748A